MTFGARSFWNSPLAEERYRRERLIRIAEVLAERNIDLPIASLARGYEESRRHLVRLWRGLRDVRIDKHVTFLLQAVDASLPGRLDASDLAAVAWAYASPALDAPPALDPGAVFAITTLVDHGISVSRGAASGILSHHTLPQ